MRISPRQITLSALGLVVFIVLLYWGGSKALDSLRDSHPWYMGAFFVVVFIATLVAALRWATILNWFLGHSGTPFRTYYYSFAFSRVSGIFLPQAVGDLAVRPIIHGLSSSSSHTDALGGSITERILDISLALIMSTPAILFLLGVVSSGWFVILTFLACSLWLLAMFTVGPLLLRWSGFTILNLTYVLRKIGARRFIPVAESCEQFVERINHNAQNSSAITRVAALTMLRYALIGGYLVLLAYALRLTDLGFIEVLVALPLAQLAAVIAITPGGIGFIEGGFLGVFAVLGVPIESVMAYLVGQRVLVNLNLLIHGAIGTITHRLF